MNIRRLILSFVVIIGFVIATVEVRGGANGATGIAEGTFVGIEQGDYAHFQIKDKNGHPNSFIILRADKSVQSYLDNPAILKGRQVRVRWEEQMIPEAGGKMKTITRIESPKK